MNEDRLMHVYLLVSLLGLGTTSLFIGDSLTPTKNANIAYITFSAICLLGITAAIFPRSCSHRDIPTDLDSSRYTVVGGVKIIHGHHVPCEGFKEHEISLKGKTVCAACTGLLIGAILALIVASHHFLGGYAYPAFAGYIGVAFSLVGLIYIPILKPRNPLLRALYNMLFVVGFSLLLVVVDNKGSLTLDLVVIGMSVYWMYSRIQFSTWGHNKVCEECNEKCAHYR